MSSLLTRQTAEPLWRLAVEVPEEPLAEATMAMMQGVAGTVTAAALPIVVARFHELMEPRYVVAYGACATSGGPYWDSYAVIPGIAESLDVHVVVPGCPPGPEFVDKALVALARSLNAEAKRA